MIVISTGNNSCVYQIFYSLIDSSSKPDKLISTPGALLKCLKNMYHFFNGSYGHTPYFPDKRYFIFGELDYRYPVEWILNSRENFPERRMNERERGLTKVGIVV